MTFAFDFPFPADIWGTVADWVMIAVTFATAIALFLTLKSQREVQNTQNRIFDIERIRLREDYRPEFNYSRFLSNTIAKKPTQYYIGIAITNISHKAARNLKVTYPDSKRITGNMLESNPRNLIKGAENAKLHLIFEPFHPDVFKEGFKFTVYYEDLVGTKYRQVVLCGFLPTAEIVE